MFFIMCLQDIWSCMNPELPVALVKCLYLLVCLPSKTEDEEKTFEELLTQVFFYQFFIMTFVFFGFCVIVVPTIETIQSSSVFCLKMPFIFPAFVVDFLPALLWAGIRWEVDRGSGDAMSHYRTDFNVRSNQCELEAASLTHPQSRVCCANKQHGPTPVRWGLVLWLVIWLAPKIYCWNWNFKKVGQKRKVTDN